MLTELVGQCRNILPLAFSALTSLRSVNTEKAVGNMFLHWPLTQLIRVYHKIHQSSRVLLYFVFVSSFLARRTVSCVGNLICNSPKDNWIGVSFTKNDQRPYSNSLGCYYLSCSGNLICKFNWQFNLNLKRQFNWSLTHLEWPKTLFKFFRLLLLELFRQFNL